jgi:hypothetical protein
MCDERERLIGYVYDECDAHERRLIDAHLDACATCRDEIGGLRAVREDLLAWEVPDHGSVWRPFAPARSAPWWRQVPAWALAAAAAVVFVIGGVGSVATEAMLSQRSKAVKAAEFSALQAPVATAGVSAADLSAVEERMLANMRSSFAQMNQRVDARLRVMALHQYGAPDLINASTTSASVGPTLAEFSELTNSVMTDFVAMSKKIQSLEKQNAALQQTVQTLLLNSQGGK